MPPPLSLLIGILLIVYFFWMDRKRIEGVSNAIWIPFIWMFFAGSRFVSQWLSLGPPSSVGDAVVDGSPLDRVVFAALIFTGILILRQRRINWNLFFAKNAWIWLYFLLGAISFFWSDYPFVSFKRWIKAVGTLVMVLVILTEERPYAAIGIILRRLAFIFLPLSVVFVKYYPYLGRQIHSWSGTQSYTGVATQKNGLGEICLIAGIYFLWNLLIARRDKNEPSHQLPHIIYILILPIWAWLFYIVNSMTSLVCFFVGAGIIIVARQPAVNREPRRLIRICFLLIVLFGIMQFAFDMKDTVIEMLGRRPDLTTRVPMWEDMLSMVKDPLLGYGYESFWLGPRLNYMREIWGMEHQAHNGYLEMYLNMGLIGVCIIGCWIVSGFRKINRQLVIDNGAAVLRLCFIVVIAIYNWTEATFYGNNNLWLLFFFGVMDMLREISNNTPASRS
jgi:exopolysaccharide production protein ExoQ